MSQGIFITGTDTEIGKTLVSCLVIDALVREGYKVIGMKPIASGAEFRDGRLQNEDALHLMQYSNVTTEYEKINPYCFEPPIAPHIAAQRANQQIDLATIGKAYSELTQLADWVIVEGVGGWSVPINNDQTVADIATELNLPVVLVVGMRLGCINHAVLTAKAIRQSGNRLLGWVANNVKRDIAVYDQVIETLRTRLACPLIAQVPFFDDDKSDLNQPIKIDLNCLNPE
jgi:dethiobiotin synthetase